MVVRYYDVYFEQGVYTTFSYEYSFASFVVVGGVWVGAIYGFLVAIGEYFLYSKIFKKTNYKWILVIGMIYFFVAFSIAQSYVLLIFDDNTGTNFISNVNFFELYTYPFFWIKLVFTVLLSIGALLVQISTSFLGSETTLSLLLGKYETPKEEQRIIMFIDMVSSTAIAEKIGNEKFMRLIQECFRDLSYSAQKNNAQIEKYVGDEVILTWKNEKDADNCLQFFFDFQNTLYRRKEFYEKSFGFHPKFRAGAHIGQMIIGQIGSGKMELTFLGDVVNSCARIQAKCGELNCKLLISDLLSNYVSDNKFRKEDHGKIELRGKNEALRLIEIQKL